MTARQVFMDTWGWLGLVNANDPFHACARQAYSDLVAQGTQFVTTNAVLYELFENSRRHFGQSSALRLQAIIAKAVAENDLAIVYLDPSVENLAWEIYERLIDQKISYVDCLSFATMQLNQLRVAFTGDWHFTLLGFDIIPAIKR
jgi:predicted nucleic acid-binding protein